MKKNSGFTLVELLAVIVLLGIIMAIAVPNALKLGSNVREQSYVTKIDLIEKSAQGYGQSNIASVKRGKAPNKDQRYKCKFKYDEDDNIETVNMLSTSESEDADLGPDTFFCFAMTIDELVKTNSLDYDEKNTCGTSCSEQEKVYYDNVVVNPKDNSVINNCSVYIYYKYKRVYAHFDRTECDKVSNYGTFDSSHAYPARRNS